MEQTQETAENQDSVAHPFVGSTSGQREHQQHQDSWFDAFTKCGMIIRDDDHRQDLALSKTTFIRGMGVAAEATTVEAVHCFDESHATRRAWESCFQERLANMARRNPDNPQIPIIALYCGSKAELALIVEHGFSFANAIGTATGGGVSSALDAGNEEEVGQILITEFDALKARGGFRGFLRLLSAHSCLNAACLCEADQNGLRHLLVCRILMGTMQLVSEDNLDIAPGFDSGADHFGHPRKMYLPYWEHSQMYNISVDAIFSFSVPPYLLAFALERSPKLEPEAIELSSVLDGLKLLLNDSNILSTTKASFTEYQEKKRSKADLIGFLVKTFGVETLVEAAKAVSEAESYLLTSGELGG